MTETIDEALEIFSRHILEETEKARAEVELWKNDLSVNTVGCVDGLTKKGMVNPPGGGVFLLNEGLLQDFLAARSGVGGTLLVHENCGYMRVVMGLTEVEQHRALIEQLRIQLKETGFALVVEPQGSAAPYMTR